MASECPPIGAPNIQIAEQRVRAGLDAALAERLSEAVAEWAVALRHVPWGDPERAAIGRTVIWKSAALLGALGRLDEAASMYRCYLERSPATDPRRPEAHARIAEIRALSMIELEVRTTPPGARLVVNAEPVGQTPWRGPVPIGAHRVRVELDGHHPGERAVELRPGAPSEVSITLRPIAIAERAPPPPPASTRWPWLVGGVAMTLTGAALASVGTAAYLEQLDSEASKAVINPKRREANAYWRAGAAAGAVGVGVIVWALLDGGESSAASAISLAPGAQGWALRF